MKTGVTVSIETLDPLREGRAADELSERLIFYQVDAKEPKNGPQVPSSLNNLKLQVERKVTKAIARSSGGFTLATPTRLIVDEENHADPKVRVRLSFKDFKKNTQGKVESAQYVIQYKTLYPEEIREAQQIEIKGNSVQRFLLDFGYGAIPVQVIHLEVNRKKEGTAFFIELGDIDNVRNGKPETQVWVRVYHCDADVLRFIPEGHKHSASEFQKALATYGRLRKEGKRVIPQCFELTSPFRIPGGLAITELRDFVGILVQRHLKNPNKPTHTNRFEIKEDELVPFGTYEDFKR